MTKCEELFRTIDLLNDKYIDFLTDICNIESPTDCKDGVDSVGKYFADKATERGWRVDIQKQIISGDAVCITMNENAKGAPICFSGHMDTVHPIGSFGDNPVWCDGDKIYGPGVVDCKGGLAAAFMAMVALEMCGFNKRPVKLILQSDEENGSRNSKKTTVQYMYKKAKGCIAFLNTEIGARNGHIISLKGICKYRFEITGKPAHSAICYTGSSAVCEAAQKIIRLEQYKDAQGITCNCGLIQGGTAENIVPDKCTFTADFRFNTDEEKKRVMEIAEEIASTTFVEGTTCKFVLVSERFAMPKTDKSIELFEKVRRIYLDNGLGDVGMIEFWGATDVADLSHMGITCLDGFGTIGGGLHKLDEYAYIDSLALAAKRLASVAYCIE